MNSPSISYYTVRPNRHTFQNDKIRSWVLNWLSEGDVVLDACAGSTDLPHPSLVRNDIAGGPNIDTEVDVSALTDEFPPSSFDAVIYDPPYGPNESETLYDSSYPGYHSTVKSEIDTVLRPGGKLIQLGWTAVGMPPRQYDREAISIFNTLGRMRDWIGIVDRKTSPTASITGSFKHSLNQEWPKVKPKRVTLNAGMGVRTDVGNTKTVTIGVTPLSEPVPEKPLSTATINRLATDLLSGRVLVPLPCGFSSLGQHPLDIIKNQGNLSQSATLTGFTNSYSPDTHIPITELAASFADVFDTILFAPPLSYFSRCYFDKDGNNLGGVNKEAREAFTSVLKPSGKVIQVGHTTTNMPSAAGPGYIRERIELFAPYTTGRYKTNSGNRYTPKTTFLTVDRLNSDTQTDGRKPTTLPCVHCGTQFPVDPSAVRKACPTCGSPPDCYCVNPDTGKCLIDNNNSKPVLHSKRWKQLRDAAAQINESHCPNSPDGTHSVSPISLINLPTYGLENVMRPCRHQKTNSTQ
jgi:hypothetical protein